MKYLSHFVFLFVIFIFSFLILNSRVFAAGDGLLKFQTDNTSINTGQDFQVKLLVNSGSTEINNVDALIIYDPAKITIKSAQSFNNFFTYFNYNPLGGLANKYLVSSFEQSTYTGKTATNDTQWATLNLNAKAAGTTSLSFECTPGTGADSNINSSSDATDIINCNGLTPLTLNIGSVGPTSTPSPTLKAQPTSVPSATPTQKPTSTPKPVVTKPPPPIVTQLPRSGTTEVTFAIAGAGVVLTIVGLLFIL